MEKLNELIFQRKIVKLESTINQKQIPQADKQILLQEVENLKQALTEHQQKKSFKKKDFISYPKTR
jgi:hypothetical protein